MKLLYVGPFGLMTGYAQAGMDYLAAIAEYQNAVDLMILPTHDFDKAHVQNGPYTYLLDYVVEPRDAFGATHAIVHANPNGCCIIHDEFADVLNNALRFAMTTWESDCMPGWLVQNLEDRFHAIIVPSIYCESVIHTDIPVYIVPHCYDVRRWPTHRPLQTATTRFLWIGAWSHRKNPLGVVKAYWSEFTDEDNVLLTIKTSSKYAIEDLQTLKREMNLQNTAPVDLITGKLSDDEIIDLHMNSDVYVSLHRGEGWGLGPFASSIVSNPVIATNYGGTSDYLEDHIDWPIGFVQTPALVPERKVLTQTPDGRAALACISSQSHGLAGDQFWAEPDLFEAAVAMRHFRVADEHGPSKRDVMDKAFGYKPVAERLIDCLRQI